MKMKGPNKGILWVYSKPITKFYKKNNEDQLGV